MKTAPSLALQVHACIQYKNINQHKLNFTYFLVKIPVLLSQKEFEPGAKIGAILFSSTIKVSPDFIDIEFKLALPFDRFNSFGGNPERTEMKHKIYHF